MTLNGVMAFILRYFSEFGSFRGALKKFTFAVSSPGEFLVPDSCNIPRHFQVSRQVVTLCVLSSFHFFSVL